VHLFQRTGIRRVLNFDRRVDQLEDALRAGQRALNGVVQRG